jgi:hypothetical protein
MFWQQTPTQHSKLGSDGDSSISVSGLTLDISGIGEVHISYAQSKVHAFRLHAALLAAEHFTEVLEPGRQTTFCNH